MITVIDCDGLPARPCKECGSITLLDMETCANCKHENPRYDADYANGRKFRVHFFSTLTDGWVWDMDDPFTGLAIRQCWPLRVIRVKATSCWRVETKNGEHLARGGFETPFEAAAWADNAENARMIIRDNLRHRMRKKKR